VANEALLRIKVVTDASQAALGLDKTAKQSSKFGSAMSKAALPAAAVGVALVALGKHALDSASNLQQAQGAVESVFGKQAGAVEELSKKSAQSMGLAQSAYLQYAAIVGSALTNAGFTTKQAVDESNKVMQRGADLAATFGGTTADAVEAINAAVSRGEFDPLEKYGVSLNMTAVNAELAARGQDKLTGSALKHAKAQVVLESVYANTSKAAGQFAREQDTAAGSAAIASAEFENASAALGEALLPAASAVATALASVARWAGKNVPLVTALAAAVGTLVTAILIYNAAMKIAAIVQVAFNVAMSANVIFLVIIAIIALIAVIVIVVKKWDVIKKAAGKAWGAVMGIVGKVIQFIKKNWLTMLAVLLGPFGVAIALIIRNWDKIKSVVQKVTDAMKSAFRSVKDVAAAVWGAIRDKVTGVASSIRTAWENAISRVKTIIGSVKDALANMVPDGLQAAMTAPFIAAKKVIDSVVSAIKGLIGWVSSLISKIAGIHFPSVPSGLKSLAGKIGLNAVAPAPGLARPRVFYSPAPAVGGLSAGAGVRASVAGGNGVTITVNGALDPDAVARQIGRLLASHDVRMGRAFV
jgi:hypothetical protein